jgi:hypothetical protein
MAYGNGKKASGSDLRWRVRATFNEGQVLRKPLDAPNDRNEGAKLNRFGEEAGGRLQAR